MKTFKDNEGRVWSLSVNVLTIRQIKAEAGIDIYDIFANKLETLETLRNDPAKLVQVLFILCDAQAEKTGVSEDSFAAGLGGDAIADAVDALLEEIIDFFPNPVRRDALRGVLTKAREVEKAALNQAMATITAVEPESIVRQLAENSKNLSFNRPESAESSRGDSH